MIIFDLDDTLIDTSGGIVPIKLKQALDKMVEAGLFLPDFSEALQQLQRLDLVATSSREAMAEFLEIHEQEKYLDLALKEIYENFSQDLPVFPFDRVLETLDALLQVHHLALVTAGEVAYQEWKIAQAGLASSFFSKIAICERGSKKPYYKKIAKELNFLPKDVIVCGDRVEKDLTPAKELGFRTIHIRKGRGRRYPALSSDIDYTIHEIYEIPEVVAAATLGNFLSF